MGSLISWLESDKEEEEEEACEMGLVSGVGSEHLLELDGVRRKLCRLVGNLHRGRKRRSWRGSAVLISENILIKEFIPGYEPAVLYESYHTI